GCLPSGLKATEWIPEECPLRVRDSLPVETSHNLIVVSRQPRSVTLSKPQDPLARVCPSEPKAMELMTLEECPLSARNAVPVETAQSLTVLSSLPQARIFPSGLKATELITSEYPLRVRNSVPVETSHSLTVFSSLLARVFPSGLKATEVT